MALSAHWNKHIEAWQGSGLTQAAYCRQHGLNPNSFSSRLHAFRSRDAAKSPTLIPVRIRNQELGTMALQLARGHRLELPAAVSALWLGGVASMPGLIATPAQIWLAVESVDMRRGIDGLSAYVQQTLGQAPCAGAAFVFRNKTGNRIKVLCWDGQGVWLCQRRLHEGRFIWPKASAH